MKNYNYFFSYYIILNYFLNNLEYVCLKFLYNLEICNILIYFFVYVYFIGIIYNLDVCIMY